MRYSTDELVALLETVRIAPSKLSQRGADRINAIIARLRAADALVSAAKEVLSDSGPLEDDSWPDQHQRDLWKAISAYEEE